MCICPHEGGLASTLADMTALRTLGRAPICNCAIMLADAACEQLAARANLRMHCDLTAQVRVVSDDGNDSADQIRCVRFVCACVCVCVCRYACP